MTAQRRNGARLPNTNSESRAGGMGGGPLRSRRFGTPRPAAVPSLVTALVMGGALIASGCRTGSSLTAPSMSKPSWWSFGTKPKEDVGTLASAPAYSGDIKKPSEAAKPYPTTSTPNGYVIAGAGSPNPGGTQPQLQAATPQAPVVYGSKPAAAPSATGGIASATYPAAPPAAPGGVAAQVGPYASLAGDTIPPPGQPLPPIGPSTLTPPQGRAAFDAAAPATAAATPMQSTAGGFTGGLEPPPARMADARAADPASPIPPAALPTDQSGYGGSRYATGGGSRFSGADGPPDSSFSSPSAFPPATAAAPASYGRPSDSAPFTPGMASPGMSVPQPPVQPAPATPGLLQPSGAPVRRPDPAYRPGSTSSYRPSRSLLADEPAPTAVRTAAYEEPAPGSVRQ
jgi:hypothetical protein